jgi:hypothetical protein
MCIICGDVANLIPIFLCDAKRGGHAQCVFCALGPLTLDEICNNGTTIPNATRSVLADDVDDTAPDDTVSTTQPPRRCQHVAVSADTTPNDTVPADSAPTTLSPRRHRSIATNHATSTATGREGYHDVGLSEEEV